MKYLALLLLCALPLTAQRKNPTEPPVQSISAKILTAKTVFLQVSTDKQEYYYKIAYKYLADWDRWKIVTDPKAADLVLKITNRDDGSLSVGSGSGFYSGGYTAASGITVGIPLHHFYLAVLDPGTGEALWGTDTDERVLQSANAKRMLKKLHEKITEAEKATPKDNQ